MSETRLYDVRASLDNQLTEKDFSQMVVKLGRVYGWRVYRTWIAIHSPAGFPDLVMCKPPRLIFAELKTERGKLSEVQQEWLAALCGVPKVETYVWRPSAWEEIERALRGEE